MSSTLDLDISQIGPHLIGHRLEVEDENGYRVGIRLARYEILPDHGDDALYILYSDPSPVAVKVRPGATLSVAATAEPARPAVNGSRPIPTAS